jgi:hypothetical protein
MNECWGRQWCGNGGQRARKKMLLHAMLLLVMVVGWSYQTSFAHAMHYVLLSSKIGDRQAFEMMRNGTTELSDTLVILQRTLEHKLSTPQLVHKIEMLTQNW